jgi:2-polyprenyl-6-methoxyphenol hydroxylase-like FAD-dependent oxidoreductase
MKNRKILISGAGIAGPCLAYWLLRYGFEPVLVERAPALRTGGYIIDFWGLGFDVAEQMGLLPALKRDGYEIHEVRIVDAKGKKTGGFSVRAFQTVMGDRYLSILRSDLSKLIYNALDGKVRTVFADSIVALEQDHNGVTVRFQHGAVERFDVVIGAGGLHSPVRNLVFGPEGRFEKYLGYYAASFSVAGYPQRDPHAFVSFAAPGRQISRYSLRDDRTVFFFAFAQDTKLPIAPHDTNAEKDVLRKIYAQDSWECPTILRALEDANDLYFDAVSQIQMSSWAQGRVALIGDACFAPSLLAGQGSALAMAAAYILAGELRNADGDHHLAFSGYERMLQPLLARKQRAARNFAGSFAPKTEFGIFLRNHITRLMTRPFIVRLFMGTLLTDPLPLPSYPSSWALAGKSGSPRG